MTDQNTEPATDQARVVKPFAAFLQEQREGSLHAELSEGLQQLVAAVVEHEKAGTLSLKISVKPAGNGLTLVIGDEVKVTAPEPARPIALWFSDSEGNVSRSDPRQPQLPLREIPSTPSVREAS